MSNNKIHPTLQQATDLYFQTFENLPDIAVFAPGRVNLIGEHTDYNDGFVLPFALPFRTYVVGSLSNLTESKIISCNFGSEIVSFEVSKQLQRGEPEWANYVKGTIYQYLDDLPRGFSFNAVIASNVPVGAGLSSSAALEVAVATFLEKLVSGLNISSITKALRCVEAEHTFANVPCGIMDQYISAMAREGSLLLIDCRSHEYTVVPFEGTGGPCLVVTNSNVAHKLNGSEFPDRVKQCKIAAAALHEKFPHITSLRDATLSDLEFVRDDIDSVVFNRAKHVIEENSRTLACIEAFKKGEFNEVGKNMTLSHVSLKDYYQVSCDELDLLVELALEVPGVLGSRMTGGGFGGCTITLVDSKQAATLQNHLKTKYKEATGIECESYQCLPSVGASEATVPGRDFGSKIEIWGNLSLPIIFGVISIISAAILSRYNPFRR